MQNRSYFSTVMGLAFRKLDVFGYYKFVTAVKNINLLPNRDNMIAQKKAKAVSSFAFKGGNYIYNQRRRDLIGGINDANGQQSVEALDYWQEPGDVTDIPRIGAT